MKNRNNPIDRFLDEKIDQILEKVEDALDNIEEQEAEYEKARKENLDMKQSFKDKIRRFINTKGKKAAIYTAMLGAIVGMGVGGIYLKIDRYNQKKENIQMLKEVLSNKSTPAYVETVTEKPTVDEKGKVITPKEKEGVTIETGDLIFEQDENGEYTLKEKEEASSFKENLQEDVKKEEELTEEELNKRAQETQEKAELTPQIDEKIQE